MRRRYTSLAVLWLSVAGCSSVQVRQPDGTDAWMSRDEFAAYTEAVFRRYNRAVDDLIVAGSLDDDEGTESAPELLRAEDAMGTACMPLMVAVTAHIEGHDLGFFERLQMPQAVAACAYATQRLETVLDGRATGEP
jgi:hypothetical protein